MQRIFILFCFISILSSLVYCTPRRGKWDITKETIEQEASPFTLKDLKGEEIKLSDYKGKFVLLVFGTTWCPYCRIEIPNLKKV